jgi:hypothetical protein
MIMFQHRQWHCSPLIVILLSLVWGTVVGFYAQRNFRRNPHTVPSDTILFEGDKKKNLSASEREQRDEEARRRQRKEDVVIGKTSAKQGEKDFALDPKGTEQEYLRQASRIEREIYLLTEAGMESLNSVSDC